ncbi:hypothetical protein QSV34_03205 [Porticoccus sp. W117]|uniref:hypothetical protein n=1 Tax=Porticoccus sp. W117 TaxID=3054777 RepID=UPI002599D213|nr:hypothetical protein [Porticoccus sp. W117]MDM3870357.1 hypothetical protein [Porticoccus sp. W117]
MQLISKFSLSLNNKRLWLTSILVLAIALTFWTGSRYPNLSEKATMGGYAQVESPLSFDSVQDIQAGDPAYKEILFTLVRVIGDVARFFEGLNIFKDEIYAKKKPNQYRWRTPPYHPAGQQPISLFLYGRRLPVLSGLVEGIQ